MMNRPLKSFASALLLCAVLFGATAAYAVPTAQDVEASINKKDWGTADSQLSQVLAAHPNNARAHYIYGQVLDKEGRSADGLAQLQQARTLDPQLNFDRNSGQFAQVERAIRQRAQDGRNSRNRSSSDSGSRAGFAAPVALAAVPAVHQGPSMMAWIGIIIVLVAIGLVLRWTLRRSRNNQNDAADGQRRDQLKRATDVLNGVRAVKLDLKLSTMPGAPVLVKEAENLETAARDTLDSLSSAQSPVPDYRLEDLERQLESIKARAEGRPDPNAGYVGGAQPSAYAMEADRFGQGAPMAPPPQVVVQQQPGGMGGMGGLLTGVLLGNMLGGSRERVIERDVPVEDDRRRDLDDQNNSNIDFGQGDDNWNDAGGGIDTGNDDSGGWSDT